MAVKFLSEGAGGELNRKNHTPYRILIWVSAGSMKKDLI